MINSLKLANEYEGTPVNEFCFEDACDGQIKIFIDMELHPDSDYWDKEFIQNLPPGFEDFFDTSNDNDTFYAQLCYG